MSLLASALTSADRSEVQLGERIYREGVLVSGAPLQARRASGDVSGAEAACVLCHRRSGLGGTEGARLVPPVAARFLFTARAATAAEMDRGHTRGPDLAHAFGRDRPRPPYSESSVLDAIRGGRSSSGDTLDPLMPRYVLGPQDGRALVAYLRQLSTRPSPGVSDTIVRLATIVAPDVDPVRKRALLDVLQAEVTLHNAAARLDQLRDQSSPGASHVRYRRWELEVWPLEGPAPGWEAQLASRYKAHPPFALLSGLSEGEWGPVERFAERTGVPVWFPSVDLPPAAEGEFYSIYFSGGVGLEAGVIARRLTEIPRPGRVLVLHGSGLAEQQAAQLLDQKMEGTKARVEQRQVEPASVAAAVATVGPADALVLFARPAMLRALDGVAPPAGPTYVSGLLGGADAAPLPPAWKRSALVVYPFELPERRKGNASRFQAWMRARNLPIVDERVQAEAYLAAQLFSARFEELSESIQREQLVERAESFVAEHVSPVIFRSLQLGVGQRFASKGAYVVRFASPEGTALRAESEWIVP